jgi:hypothetical protein
MRIAPRAAGALVLFAVLAAGAFGGNVLTGGRSSDAECFVNDSSAEVGQLLTFTASGLNGGGPTTVEMISGTNGDFYYRWNIGNVSSYDFTWRYLAPGTYAAVFSTAGKGAWRMKCDVILNVI